MRTLRYIDIMSSTSDPRKVVFISYGLIAYFDVEEYGSAV